jgi:DNA-binding beta-propeller fold protein YncE
MAFLRTIRFFFIAAALLLWVSCGDTYRPVVIPNQPVPVNPRNNNNVFAITTNVGQNPGAGMQIDVAGDTVLGVANTGRSPIFAALSTNPVRLLVVNAGEDSLTSFSPGVTGIVVSTIALPPGSGPVFAGGTESNIFYVANHSNDSVSIVSTLSNQVNFDVALAPGSKPVALAEMPSAVKVYVANQGTNSVQSMNVVDRSLNPPLTDVTINNPVAVAARVDSTRIYVLSQGNGDLVEIDTAQDTLLPTGISAGAGANFMLYDSLTNRLYLANPVSGTVTIVSISTDPPAVLATLSVPNVVGVATLPDGSRAYAVSSVIGTDAITSVTVINAQSTTVLKTISLPAVTANSNCTSVPHRVTIAAGGDSSRVYVANCDAGNVSIINTTGDVLLTSLPAPVSAANPLPGQTYPPPQNPVFIVSGQ